VWVVPLLDVCGVIWALATDELERHARTKDGRDARLDHAAEASFDPPPGLWRSLDAQALSGELVRTQVLQPDAIGRLADGACKLCLHA
jgi:hypothetical protein